MPVHYEIDKEHGIIRTRCEGNTTFAEVIGHFGILERDPDCPTHLDVVLDLSTLTSLPTSDQLEAVRMEVGRVRSRIRFGVLAIVARSTAAFGMARMFETLAESHFRVSMVFRGRDEAEEWLALQRAKS